MLKYLLSIFLLFTQLTILAQEKILPGQDGKITGKLIGLLTKDMLL